VKTTIVIVDKETPYLP